MELHRMRIIIFFIVLISSDSEEVKKNLTGTEGGSITLPDPVMEEGFLIFGRKNIAMVNERKIKIYEEIYKNKVLWDKNTGLFTITGLQRNDSGIYNIDSKVGTVFSTSYKLTVYAPVSAPNVTKLSESVAESCSLLCSVEKAEETTLLWYKDEVIVNQSSSVLSLPLTVHKKEFRSSYRCVAANPAENKTHPVNVTMFCGGQDDTDNTSDRNTQSYLILRLFLIPIVVFGNAVAVCIVLTKVKRRTKREMTAP